MTLCRYLLLASAALLFSVGCTSFSQQNQQKLITKFYQQVDANNAAAVADMLAFPPSAAVNNSIAEEKFQFIVEEASKQFTAKGGLNRVEVIDSQMNDDHTSVTVNAVLHFNNGSIQNETINLVKTDAGWKIS